MQKSYSPVIIYEHSQGLGLSGDRWRGRNGSGHTEITLGLVHLVIEHANIIFGTTWFQTLANNLAMKILNKHEKQDL